MLPGNVKVVQRFHHRPDWSTRLLFRRRASRRQTRRMTTETPTSACLKQLAYHWPEPTPASCALCWCSPTASPEQRPSQGGDQLNPDVEGASQACKKPGIVPYPFFWLDPIVPDPNRRGRASRRPAELLATRNRHRRQQPFMRACSLPDRLRLCSTSSTRLWRARRSSPCRAVPSGQVRAAGHQVQPRRHRNLRPRQRDSSGTQRVRNNASGLLIAVEVAMLPGFHVGSILS